MAASVIGLRHFAQVSSMKRSKDIVVVPQLARGLAQRESAQATSVLQTVKCILWWHVALSTLGEPRNSV